MLLFIHFRSFALQCLPALDIAIASGEYLVTMSCTAIIFPHWQPLYTHRLEAEFIFVSVAISMYLKYSCMAYVNFSGMRS